RMVEYYEQLEDQVKRGLTTWEEDHLSNLAIHYLYTRSYFLQDRSAQANRNSGLDPDREPQYLPLDGKIEKVVQYFLTQSQGYWTKKGVYSQGMIGLYAKRLNKLPLAQNVVKSLAERALHHDELGMYWKYPNGYFWNELPLETHSLMIELFEEVAADKDAVYELKVWLLKNKQTNHWKTTKATASAVYALLRSGDNWLLEDQPLEIGLGKRKDELAAKWNAQILQAQSQAEAGTGYFKTSFGPAEIDQSMGRVTVKNPNSTIAWGGLYWQYFEQLDKITTFEETPLELKKQLFRVDLNDRGEVLTPLTEGAQLKPGDKLMVRIELRVDRPMEYVHMKDMRASGFEPINVLSRYKWQGGLGYYESTRDVSTNFFFSYLPTGTHVFEYPLRVVHKGDFSNGITTIQCMYAPEFTSHSEGIRVAVE
ncbi:MAG: alpha-2-macroglobulin, partial [Phaeodactylibacter sp.]|nr:alpha-2-macroglobulin [Phaeodactylibacter sp.]